MTSDVIEIHETNAYYLYLLSEILTPRVDMRKSIVEPIERVREKYIWNLPIPKTLMENMGKALCKILSEDLVEGNRHDALVVILKGKILEDVSPELRKSIEGWLVLYDL